MMGKIQRCSEVTQARFMRLSCMYWNKETNLLEEDARIEIDDDHFEILVSKKIISTDGINISIDFLDEQFDNILETSKQASKAGKASAAARKLKAQRASNDRSTPVQRNPTDKIRKEKIEIREELTNSISWIDNISMKKKREDVKLKLDEFLTNQELSDNLDRPISDVKKHFISWLDKQPGGVKTKFVYKS